MMILIPIALFIAVLVIELFKDYKTYLNHGTVKHAKKPERRLAMLLPSMVGFTMLSHASWFLVFPYVIVMEAFTWWLFFDGLYNKIRGFDWWFTGGHDEPDDSKLDQWLERVGPTKAKIYKIGSCGVLITIYIITK